MPSTDIKQLGYAIDEITEITTGLGLDFYSLYTGKGLLQLTSLPTLCLSIPLQNLKLLYWFKTRSFTKLHVVFKNLA
ncbi:hypothetical protein [Paenibacillus physcomitrellae]|uniref:Uncharacterized protein n=1 Tax=Paenibacillus physcomitrellae TaxID=1619311 RepID=A0ABQ1FPG3_9BACL|nr:hypothetical protein [Paenibacillus physcomitrellae]GGA24655.1 hypothetical protein GCM10010917_06900 [Paenibacillus physcomitrellae]